MVCCLQFAAADSGEWRQVAATDARREVVAVVARRGSSFGGFDTELWHWLAGPSLVLVAGRTFVGAAAAAAVVGLVLRGCGCCFDTNEALRHQLVLATKMETASVVGFVAAEAEVR